MAAKVRFSSPPTLAKPPGYSYLVETTGPGRTVYFAGQLGLDLDNRLVGAPGDFPAQCARAFENLELALAAAGAGFKDLVKINSYLVDIGTNIAHFREVRDRFLNTEAPPASTTVGVPALARPGALFEIEAVAVLPAASAGMKQGRGAAKKSTKKSARTKRRKSGRRSR
jgi:enamine deaminase RidA (YjgF/YER057c/UK114 family)